MLRLALFQSARSLSRAAARNQASIVRFAPAPSLLQSRRPLAPVSQPCLRFYSAPAGMTQEEVEGRITNLLTKFDKVKDASKITSKAHFANDLGLDSLDTVEVVMAIEEEFSIEIPDKDADSIHSGE
ncbi:MAG: Acyl carrier protein, mitochondrial [Lichina confinis]|nr:MAG: Acyl carrier protein, mitochondrial [Lichina confinis]